jgi:hypothetical protein
MRVRETSLATVIVLVMAAGAGADFVQLVAHDPASNSSFDVFVDLVPPSPITPPSPVTPPSPIFVDLADSAHPLFTTNVDTHALFTFGMIGQNGETFSFIQQSLDHPLGNSQHLDLLFSAQGSQGTFFDALFDASYRDDTGQHAPLSGLPPNPIIPPSPIFPQGSLSIDYTLQADPPFTVGVLLFHPGIDEPVTFSSTPEPGTLTSAGIGFALLAAWRWRRRSRAPIGGVSMRPMAQ